MTAFLRRERVHLNGALTVSTRPMSRRRGCAKSRRRVALRALSGLEALEDRCLMSSFQWASDVSGNWNNAANWVDQNDNPGVPVRTTTRRSATPTSPSRRARAIRLEA